MNVFVHFPTIICKSGMQVSIQASDAHYCNPRTDTTEEYTEVELGFPSVIPPDYIQEYCEDRWQDEPDYLNSVYPYVPMELVDKWIQDEGGIDLGKTIANWNKNIAGKILRNYPC